MGKKSGRIPSTPRRPDALTLVPRCSGWERVRPVEGWADPAELTLSGGRIPMRGGRKKGCHEGRKGGVWKADDGPTARLHL